MALMQKARRHINSKILLGPLALSLVFGPSPALALRQTGLEEGNPDVRKEMIAQLQAPSGPVGNWENAPSKIDPFAISAGLEENEVHQKKIEWIAATLQLAAPEVPVKGEPASYSEWSSFLMGQIIERLPSFQSVHRSRGASLEPVELGEALMWLGSQEKTREVAGNIVLALYDRLDRETAYDVLDDTDSGFEWNLYVQPIFKEWTANPEIAPWLLRVGQSAFEEGLQFKFSERRRATLELYATLARHPEVPGALLQSALEGVQSNLSYRVRQPQPTYDAYGNLNRGPDPFVSYTPVQRAAAEALKVFQARGIGKDVSAGLEEDEAHGLEEIGAIRERINLLPVAKMLVPSVGVIAGPEDEQGWAYGVALLNRGRTAVGGTVPVIFLVENTAEVEVLQSLGVGSEVVYRVGSSEYPTREVAIQEATAYLRNGLGIASVISLGVSEKISPAVEQVLLSLFGIRLDSQTAVRWQGAIDAVVYTFQQA